MKVVICGFVCPRGHHASPLDPRDHRAAPQGHNGRLDKCHKAKIEKNRAEAIQALKGDRIDSKKAPEPLKVFFDENPAFGPGEGFK